MLHCTLTNSWGLGRIFPLIFLKWQPKGFFQGWDQQWLNFILPTSKARVEHFLQNRCGKISKYKGGLGPTSDAPLAGPRLFGHMMHADPEWPAVLYGAAASLKQSRGIAQERTACSEGLNQGFSTGGKFTPGFKFYLSWGQIYWCCCTFFYRDSE